MTSFLTNFHKQVLTENVKVGDTVTVIGKDEFKGLRGTVTNQKLTTGEKIFIVELHANNRKIERAQLQIRKEYAL